MYGIFRHETFATSPTSGDIVRLNVGGHMYTTTKTTLSSQHSIALMNILKNCDREGNVFIDRNGRMFEYILEFLRTDKLCLPDDFSDFDSLTTEVDFFEIPGLSSCLERAKKKKFNVKYIEILETQVNGNVNTVLKGRKEDLEALHLTIPETDCKFEPEDAEDSSYVEITLDGRKVRLQLTEVLSKKKWTCESSDFSSTTSHFPGYPHIPTIQHCFRDRWKK